MSDYDRNLTPVGNARRSKSDEEIEALKRERSAVLVRNEALRAEVEQLRRLLRKGMEFAQHAEGCSAVLPYELHRWQAEARYLLAAARAVENEG